MSSPPIRLRRPATITFWDGAEVKLLTNPQIENLPSDDQNRYVTKLHEHSLDNGRDESPWYHEWKKFDARCRNEGCSGTAWEHHKFCVRHLDIDDIDPDNAVRRRATKAKLRMAELLDKSVTELEKMVDAPEGEIPAAIRLKAIDTVFDRAHLPRQTAASVQLDADVTVVSIDAAEIIQGRLDRLAGTLVQGELEGIAEASAAISDEED